MRFQSFERLLMPSSGRLISRSLLMLLVLRALSLAEAKVACTRNTECEELLFTGSECRNGFCSNPFEKGCLNALLKAADNEQTLFSTSNSTESEGEGIREKISAIEKRLKNMIRVCNSEDPPGAAETGICTDYSQRDNKRKGPSLYSDYNEIRIMNQNWESPMFAAWILQILLSEILQVPTSIETGEEDLKMNFYDPDNRFEYGKANEWGAVERAAEAPGADCRIVQQQDKYKSCAHVIPELWNGHFADMRILHRKGVLESPQNVGATGQQALYGMLF